MENRRKCIEYVKQAVIHVTCLFLTSYSSLVKSTFQIFQCCKINSQHCWRKCLVFSSFFSDLFHRKKLATATWVQLQQFWGITKKKKTFNKIKTFKYNKIFAWKYKTTQKHKIKSHKKGEKKAEVLGLYLPRTLRTRTNRSP